MKSVHAYSFETTGMAIIPKALSLEKVAEAKQLIQNNWPSGAPWKFPVLHLGRVFWEMMTQPAMLELCQQFAGDHFRMDHAFGLTSNGAHAQLHGGPQSSQYSCFYLPLSGEKHPGRLARDPPRSNGGEGGGRAAGELPSPPQAPQASSERSPAPA